MHNYHLYIIEESETSGNSVRAKKSETSSCSWHSVISQLKSTGEEGFDWLVMYRKFSFLGKSQERWEKMVRNEEERAVMTFRQQSA